MSQQVYGVQPVLQAIRTGTPIERILLARAEGGQTQRIRELAKKKGLKVYDVDREELDRRLAGARHQGVLALLDANEVQPVALSTVLEEIEQRGELPLIVMLDGIQDPHNLGAIVRSAYALGAHAVVVEKNRAAPVSAAAVRASAGAALQLPIVRVTNLKHALDELEANTSGPRRRSWTGCRCTKLGSTDRWRSWSEARPRACDRRWPSGAIFGSRSRSSTSSTASMHRLRRGSCCTKSVVSGAPRSSKQDATMPLDSRDRFP